MRIPTLAVAFICLPAFAAAQRLPPYLADRGTGIVTSMFGEYVRRGELLIYPFYKFTSFQDFEYKPAELGFGLDQDFRGKFREHEALIFLAYGLSDRLALEFESVGNHVQLLAQNPVLRARVSLLIDLFEPLDAGVRVDLGRRDGGVTQ